jgi:predicted helicase
MQALNLKPSHKLVKSYYETLGQYGQLNIDYEGAVRSAFQALLRGCGKQFEWTLVPEYPLERPKARLIKVDGAMVDSFRLARGFWEAKDEQDDLEKEVKAKFEKGYPKSNIIFQAPERAILYQNGIRQGLNEDLRDGKNLVELLKVFFSYRELHLEEWEAAVKEFKEYIPQLAKAVEEKIEQQRQTNKAFVQSFDAFYELCRQAINPNLSVEAVEKMLVQHLLTERIFRKIFDNPEFTRRNVIAVEIEKVIDSLTAKQFSRDAFLKDLDRFYRAIELAAETTEDYSEKQKFINTVYERFFQGYSPKEADTHGIVYTPQPIVDFMVRSVENILEKEFGRSLSDKDVHILDPFVGTGNFITRVMKEIKTSALPYKYDNELHCNEVMLLPYYVASMNIEHEYYEKSRQYKPFPGICLVDTFDMRTQSAMFAEENLVRIHRQNVSPIFVALGNPPYNAWQVSENDNNKNRKYAELETRVRETYGKLSKATNKNALWDPYVKAFRWASDRVVDNGLVAFVTNSGYLDALATDGLRKSLASEFDIVYVVDLGGNVRRNPKLSGTTHNVFGIQVGVCITFLVKKGSSRYERSCRVLYARVGEYWTNYEKLRWLDDQRLDKVKWREAGRPEEGQWIADASDADYASFIPIGSPVLKGTAEPLGSLFATYSRGAETTRDSWSYNFSEGEIACNIPRLVETYNAEVDRWKRSRLDRKELDQFLVADEKRIKWCSKLKQAVADGLLANYDPSFLRVAVYRPFTKQSLFFDPLLTHRRGVLPQAFPDANPNVENIVLWVKVGSDWPMFALATSCIPDLLPQGGSQCFPMYIYDGNGTIRRENITDWALNEFCTHYSDTNISKWDIFHYVYAVLHHPVYRKRYAANLKRELPRIPYVKAGPSSRTETADPVLAQDDAEVFWRLVEAGRRLAELHVDYEKQVEYPLERIEKGQLNWRVEKMRLSKDKSTLVYNDFLTLKGIPPKTYEYRLGNRSALEWVVDQYQVTTDKRSGIVNDPNRDDDPEYIVRLIGQVIMVSLETMKIVNGLPEWAVNEQAESIMAETA